MIVNITKKFRPGQLLHLRVMKAVCICLTLFAVFFLIEEAVGRRMSLKAKRKKFLRTYMEREARRRNDTLMQRLLYEQSSKYNRDDPKKPPWPKSYEDISNYTLPPNLCPGPNESAIDNSDFVHEMVPCLTRKTKKKKSTTVRRNRTTSKYKKKLAQRSSTTLSPEVLEALRNFTVISYLNLTPVSIEDETGLRVPVENLDPNYYTYISKAWTTTNFTNSSTTSGPNTSAVDTDEYNDFGPATANVEQTLNQFTADISKVLSIVKEYEKLTNVVGDGIVDKTNGQESKVRSLIGNNDDFIGKNLLLNNTDQEIMWNDNYDNNKERVNDKQYNDYNERYVNLPDTDIKSDIEDKERIDLIEDILSKYCKENLTEFENNLRKDQYYNTLRSVLKLFVKEFTKDEDIDMNDTYGQEETQGTSIAIDEQKCSKCPNQNDMNEVLKPENIYEDEKDLSLNTMKPLIHRIKDVVDQNEVNTIHFNLVTEDNIETTTDNVPNEVNRDVGNDIDGTEYEPADFENSSKNDKVVAEELLKNKLKNEINQVNCLIDKLNIYNASVKYKHIKIQQNASLHDLVENFRQKRSRSEEDYFAREEVKKRKLSGILRRVDVAGMPPGGNGKPDAEKARPDVERARLNIGRTRPHTRKPSPEEGPRKTTMSPSKEKYFWDPDWPTHDPGDILWKQVKRDYETDKKVRKAIDTSYIHEEKFNSKMWRNEEKKWDYEDRLKRKKRQTKSEEDYWNKEYVRKMKADHKKRCLTDESPETTEGTTMDTRFLDISRSQRPGGPIDINDLGLNNPSSFVRKLKRRDVDNVQWPNKEDVFERYDPCDSHFFEDLAKHRRRRRHVDKRSQREDLSILMNKINKAVDTETRYRARRNIDGPESAPRELSVEHVKINEMEYDMYHGLRYGVTEVAEGEADLTGMYTRYTAASVGPYQKRRYEAFRRYFLQASSTWRDPFIKVSFAVCPFCGDYFGNHEDMQFHQNYNHFNVFSTVVPVTNEPTPTKPNAPKKKDMNDIFEKILKDADLASASEKWGDYIDENINPTKLQEYKKLLFNESVTAFQTVPVHLSLETDELTTDSDVRVLSYPSPYHERENWTYPLDILKMNRKSIPVVNLYENPEEFMKKLVNHEPILPEEEQERIVMENKRIEKLNKKTTVVKPPQ